MDFVTNGGWNLFENTSWTNKSTWAQKTIWTKIYNYTSKYLFSKTSGNLMLIINRTLLGIALLKSALIEVLLHTRVVWLMYTQLGCIHSGTLKYTRSEFYDINLVSFTKDFRVFKTQLWPWLAETKLLKIGGFQKCKIHSSGLKGFRITACQSWCIFAPCWDSYSRPYED